MVDELEVAEVRQDEIDDDADVLDAHLTLVSHIGDQMLLVREELLAETTDEVELDD